jgi:hypothetical protein
LFKSLFGGSNRLPDKKTLAKWFAGADDTNINDARRYHMAFLQAFLDELDRSDIVRRFASSADLSGDGEERVKAHVCQLIQCSRHFTLKTVTPSQWAVVQRICEDISSSGPGELYAAAVGVALANAMKLWYEEDYERSIGVATHIVEHLDANAGEAYRIRAFGHFSAGRFAESKADLERALECNPMYDGVKELLGAATRAQNIH